MTATIFEAKAKFSELVKRAQAGEEVIITSGREKTPVIEFKPILPKKPMRLGALAHLNLQIPDSFFAPLSPEELSLWEDGGPDDPLNWSEERMAKANAESAAKDSLVR